MDKFEKLVSNAQFAVGILGDSRRREYALVDLYPPLSEKDKQDLHKRRFRFIGVIGLTEAGVRVALAEPLDDVTASTLSRAFCQKVEDAINNALEPKGDSADGAPSLEWLTRLYALPDTRQN